MFEFVQGEVIELSPTMVMLQVGSVGLRLQISLNTEEQIRGKKDVKLYTHLYVKNEGQNFSGFDLYGFATSEERLYFGAIISVSGIGATTARLMLSSMKPNEIALAIGAENVSQITKVKGIGPKTAKRLILELKDKIPAINQSITIDGENAGVTHNTIEAEALSALTLLGFSRTASQKAIQAILKAEQVDSVEMLVKLCLKKL